MVVTKKFLDDLTYEVIGSAIEVHKVLGPGLLESIYHKCLVHEFFLRRIQFVSEMFIPVYFKGIEIEAGLRTDFYVEDILVVEIKAVTEIAPIHQAQLLTYMKLLKSAKGILINFNCVNLFKEGQKTFVNQYYSNLPSY